MNRAPKCRCWLPRRWCRRYLRDPFNQIRQHRVCVAPMVICMKMSSTLESTERTTSSSPDVILPVEGGCLTESVPRSLMGASTYTMRLSCSWSHCSEDSNGILKGLSETLDTQGRLRISEPESRGRRASATRLLRTVLSGWSAEARYRRIQVYHLHYQFVVTFGWAHAHHQVAFDPGYGALSRLPKEDAMTRIAYNTLFC